MVHCVPSSIRMPAAPPVPSQIRRSLASCIAIAAALQLCGCGSADRSADSTGDSTGDDSKIDVFVSVLPQKEVVERIGGSRVRVHTMVEAGSDPHSFSATAKQMVALGRADVYLTIGMRFEQQYLPKIRQTRPDLAVASMLTGIELMGMDPAHSHAHEHEGDDDHGHAHGEAEAGADGHGEELDTHVWLAPALLKVMAWNVSAALSAADPEGAAGFEANVAAFETELDALDARIRALLEPHAGKAFYVFHPAFAYFAEAYGLRQVAVESAGQKPSTGEMATLLNEMRDAGARVIFSQPQFDDRPAKAIASQIGATVASIDPLARDVTANLERIADALDKGFRQGP